MDSQQLYERLKPHINKVEEPLDRIVKKAQEKAGILKIGGYQVSIGLYSIRNDKRPTQSGYYYLTMYIYNKDDKDNDKVISCRLDHQIGRIICDSYDGNGSKTFELPYSPQRSLLLRGIKKKTLDMLYYNLEEPTNRGKPYINIEVEASRKLNNLTKENPKISIYDKEFIFNTGEFEFKVSWWYPSVAPKL
jgi:hypothetical protein